MRKLTSDLILLPDGKLASGYTLIMDEEVVVDLVNSTYSDAEYFNGVLCPGFINTHGHLELSHLKNKINRGNGLTGFISEIIKIRNEQHFDIIEQAKYADLQMWKNGIQASGDICNTDETFEIKSDSRIRYHNFIELYTMQPEMAKPNFLNGKKLIKKSIKSGSTASLVPHAPYSVPGELFTMIQKHHRTNAGPWSIHNQETDSENSLFISNEGDLHLLFQSMKNDMSWLKATGKNSLPSIIEYLPKQSNLLFVHNTFTVSRDVEYLKEQNLFDQSWFCFCPNANLYIENTMPDILNFIKEDCKIVIGTDSLASNNELSVLSEIKAIHQRYKKISPATLLMWATKNGANFFNWSDLGSFNKGNKPGVLCLKGVDNKTINSHALVDRIV